MSGLGNQFLRPDWPAGGNVALPFRFCMAGLARPVRRGGTVFGLAGPAEEFDALLESGKPLRN